MPSGPQAATFHVIPDDSLLTSLDPPEANPHSPETEASIGAGSIPPDDLDPLQTYSPAVDFRHSGWKHDRRRVYESFRRTGQTSNRLHAFRECGKNAFVYESVERPGEYTIGGSSCHDRFCLPCARERSRIIAQNVLEKIEGKQARFLTLTLKSTNESLEDLLLKLTTDFAALRRSKLWRNKVVGGVAFIEIKWSAKRQRWHPHLHCMLQGRYLPVGPLSQLWFKITHTSRIVDIVYVKDGSHVTHYITKYASKPLDHTVTIQPDRLDEAVDALKGKRLCLTFGTWRGCVLTQRDDDGDWIQLGSVVELIDRAERGHEPTIAILNQLQVTFTVRTRGSPSSTVKDVSSPVPKQSTFNFALVSPTRWDA